MNLAYLSAYNLYRNTQALREAFNLEQIKRTTMEISQSKKLIVQQLWSIITRSAPTLGPTLVAVVLLQYIAHTGSEPFNPARALWQGLGGQFLMSSLMSRPIERLSQEIRAIFQEVDNTFNQSQYLAIRQQAIERELPEDARELVTKLISTIGAEVKEDAQQDLEALRYLANLPFDVRMPIEKSKFHETMRSQIDQLLAPFEPILKSRMRLYIRNLIISLNQNADSSSRPKSVSLDGPPGIGKTRFVQQLGKILSLPVFIVSPSDLSASYGSYYEYRGSPGLLDKALKQFYETHQSSAGILLFDEFDKQIKEEDSSYLIIYLLNITQQNSTVFESGYLGIDLPINNTLCFFNCNIDFTQSLSEKNKLAFDDRLEKWHFEPLSRTAKKEICLKFYQRALSEYQIETNLRREHTVERIIASDDAPGVRQLEDKIVRFIGYEASQSYFEDWAPNPDYSLDEAHGLSSPSSLLQAADISSASDTQDNHSLPKPERMR